MKHIYLAPHLDDAVLSCGGAIHRHATAGEGVLVITIFTAEPDRDANLSAFASKLHSQWGSLSQPMALRRAEDVAAVTLLGAKTRHLDYCDAAYRTVPGGQWAYPDLKATIGEVHPDDSLASDGAKPLADRLAQIIPLQDQPVLYAPMGVGHHVDHQIVHAAARRLSAQQFRVAFFEEYPYAEQPGAIQSALTSAGAEGWSEDTIAINVADLTAKISALSYYRSQMAVLFGSSEAMSSRVWAFAARRSAHACLAERVWWPQ